MTDLFEHAEQQPPQLRPIVEKYSAMDDGDPYAACAAFLEEVEAIGYTFDYGLDGIPVDLRPINPESSPAPASAETPVAGRGDHSSKPAGSDLQSALGHTYELLERLLNSSALDRDTEANDCLEVFAEYDWEKQAGYDDRRFRELVALGNDGDLSRDQLDEFMSMVSSDGETHLYHTIYEARQALKRYYGLVFIL